MGEPQLLWLWPETSEIQALINSYRESAKTSILQKIVELCLHNLNRPGFPRHFPGSVNVALNRPRFRGRLRTSKLSLGKRPLLAQSV